MSYSTVSYSTVTYYPSLTWHDMATAQHLPLSIYAPGAGGAAGYENAALYAASYVGAESDALFSWTGLAGAIYSITSASFYDPHDLIVYDAQGQAIVIDDRSGFYGTDHLTFIAPYTGTYYVDASWVQGDFLDEQVVALSIREDLDPIALTIIAGTSGANVLDGTKGDDDLYGYGGDDSLFGGGGNDYIDGGTGIDSAFYNGARANFQVLVDGDRIRVSDRTGNEGFDLLSNIERLDFADVSVALDVNGEGGQAYRLYQAAFDRTPDKVGLGYWIAQLDDGTSLAAVATAFVASAEFKSLYSAKAGNTGIVTQFYENVLNRAPDQAGVNYWVNILDQKQDTVANVLVAFSESRENYAQLIGAMENGFEYQVWG